MSKYFGYIAIRCTGEIAQDSYGNVVVFKTIDEALCLGGLKPVLGITPRLLIRAIVKRARKNATIES